VFAARATDAAGNVSAMSQPLDPTTGTISASVTITQHRGVAARRVFDMK
jgi:hypothetical protein